MPAADHRSLSGALKWARSQVGKTRDPNGDPYDNQCLGFVRQCWGLDPVGIRTAAGAWAETRFRHRDKTPPPGALVWFDGPTSADHVEFSIGNGKTISNDVVRDGRIDFTSINQTLAKWNCTYRGWTEDYPRFGRLPLDLIGEKPETNNYKIGQRVIVSTDAGLKARSGPGLESATLLYRNGKLLTVAKGYRIDIEKIEREDGYIWLRGERYWYGTPDEGRQFVRVV